MTQEKLAKTDHLCKTQGLVQRRVIFLWFEEEDQEKLLKMDFQIGKEKFVMFGLPLGQSEFCCTRSPALVRE